MLLTDEPVQEAMQTLCEQFASLVHGMDANDPELVSEALQTLSDAVLNMKSTLEKENDDNSI